MNIETIQQAIAAIAKEKGLSEELVLDAVKEAIKKGFIKKINGDDDAYVEIIFDDEKKKIYGTHKRFVVPNDYGTDYIDIRLEEALKIKKGVKVDDEIVETYDLSKDEEVGRGMALSIKSILNQKLAEAEKNALFERFHDKKDEMITGTVERCDSVSCTVKIINGPSLTISRRDLIGDETFAVGDLIRLYVSDVSQTGKGSQIKVTRASEGFLKRIFEEEIHEVYDGTVIIKGIARLAGVRSKVSVYTPDENVDAIGAIIGPNGTRIMRVVNHLGGSKEKIDVFLYNENPGLYICEALRPAVIKGIALHKSEDGRNKEAIAIVDDGQSSLAFGKKFANIRLASKLTGWEIKILEESQAAEQEITYVTPEDLKKEEAEKARQAQYEKYLRSVKEASGVKEETPVAETTETVEDPVVETVVAQEAEKVAEETPVVETVVAPEAEKVAEETPVVEVPTVKKVEVKTTASLDELEKSLEDSKAKSKAKDNKGKGSKRPKKITDEEVGIEKQDVMPSEAKKTGMAIYTEEELAELEKEELEEDYDDLDEDEEIDYDEYDKYYDDDDK